MEWYKTLDVNQKINLKACCEMLCGISWYDLGLLFSFAEKIAIVHSKLKLEGFDV
jgi:hypothetical protein